MKVYAALREFLSVFVNHAEARQHPTAYSRAELHYNEGGSEKVTPVFVYVTTDGPQGLRVKQIMQATGTLPPGGPVDPWAQLDAVDPDLAERLRSLARELAPYGCKPTMPPVKVIDYARTALMDLSRSEN